MFSLSVLCICVLKHASVFFYYCLRDRYYIYFISPPMQLLFQIWKLSLVEEERGPWLFSAQPPTPTYSCQQQCGLSENYNQRARIQPAWGPSTAVAPTAPPGQDPRRRRGGRRRRDRRSDMNPDRLDCCIHCTTCLPVCLCNCPRSWRGEAVLLKTTGGGGGMLSVL